MPHLRLYLRIAIPIALLLGLTLLWSPRAEAQTPITDNCIFSWSPNQEPDLAGYRAWASNGAISTPPVTILKPATQTSCQALGVTQEGTWTFSVVAFDDAQQASSPSTVIGVLNLAPAPPGGLQLSAQPLAMTVTPNPLADTAIVAWQPGACTQQFVISRLVSGKWVEVGRTTRNWFAAPLVDSVNQPYGVSAICS